jgi:hypothetical protein
MSKKKCSQFAVSLSNVMSTIAQQLVRGLPDP